MAVVARICALDVIARFTGGRGSVVTRGAGRGHGTVVHVCRPPGIGGVAVIARICALDVIARFTGGYGPVVAG